MISIRTIEYEYKTISSFFHNHCNENHYDEIKNTVIEHPLIVDDFHKKILKMHRFLLLATTINDGCYEKLLDYYKWVINEEITNDTLTRLAHESTYQTRLDIFTVYRVLSNIKKLPFWEAYFCFVLASQLFKQLYKEYVIIPKTLFESLESISCEEIKVYVMDGIIRQHLRNFSKYDTQNYIEKAYLTNKFMFEENNISNLYLFGSISKGLDHIHSDVDMVIKVTRTDENTIRDAMDFVKKYNKTTFYKNSDVYLYDDFIEQNPNISLLKIF